MLAETDDGDDDEPQWSPCARAEWEALFRQAGRTGLEQSWAYGEAIAARYGQSVDRHLITDGAAPLALLQAFRRRYWQVGVTRILRGPVWLLDPLTDPRADAVCRSVARRYRARRLDFLSWLPDLPDAPRSAALIEAQGLRRVVTGHATAWLDLARSREQLLAGMHGKWRAALRKAEREGLEVCEDLKPRQRQASLLLYEAFRRKKRFVGPTGDFLAAVDAADKDALLSLTARRGGELLAGVMLLRHGASATYTASWTSAGGREGQAHNLLLWRAIERLKDGGTRWLDLGGLNTESQQGLARFKLGLGGEVSVLTGSYL
ncbi:MAG: GNAT family N-acetyltransferase [Kiloniellaceae bacterium]